MPIYKANKDTLPTIVGRDEDLHKNYRIRVTSVRGVCLPHGTYKNAHGPLRNGECGDPPQHTISRGRNKK